MHLPDHFINSGAAAALAGAAIAAVGFAVAKLKSTFFKKVPALKAKLSTFPNSSGSSELSWQNRLTQAGKEKMWSMASVGSLIFAAQTVNFPIGNNVSGHLLGGCLAALILGPLEALLVLTVVLSAQSFMFADGGVLALGANIVNLAVIGGIGGFIIYRRLNWKNSSRRKQIFSVFLAAWMSVILAATAASVELSFFTSVNMSSILPSMLKSHIFIGLAEAVITVIIIRLLMSRNYKLAIHENAD